MTSDELIDYLLDKTKHIKYKVNYEDDTRIVIECFQEDFNTGMFINFDKDLLNKGNYIDAMARDIVEIIGRKCFRNEKSTK